MNLFWWEVQGRRAGERRILQMGIALLLVLILKNHCEASGIETSYNLIEGKTREVCKDYVLDLKKSGATAANNVCYPRSNRSGKFLELEWEEMDLIKNIELAYRAEMSFGIYQNHPERHPSFLDWRERFESAIRAKEIHPRLKKTRVDLISGKLQTILGYVRNARGCESELDEMGASENIGYHLFFFDDLSGKLERDYGGSDGSDYGGTILLYQGTPHLINAVTTGMDIYVYWNRRSNTVYAPQMLCHIGVKNGHKPRGPGRVGIR